MTSRKLVQPPRVQAPPPAISGWIRWAEEQIRNLYGDSPARVAITALDIAGSAITFGSMAPGALDNFPITAPNLQSGPEGSGLSRWTGDAAGIHFYDTSGNATINLDASTGEATITGAFQTAAPGVTPRANMAYDSLPVFQPIEGPPYSGINYIDHIGTSYEPSSISAGRPFVGVIRRYSTDILDVYQEASEQVSFVIDADRDARDENYSVLSAYSFLELSKAQFDLKGGLADGINYYEIVASSNVIVVNANGDTGNVGIQLQAQSGGDSTPSVVAIDIGKNESNPGFQVRYGPGSTSAPIFSVTPALSEFTMHTKFDYDVEIGGSVTIAGANSITAAGKTTFNGTNFFNGQLRLSSAATLSSFGSISILGVSTFADVHINGNLTVAGTYPGSGGSSLPPYVYTNGSRVATWYNDGTKSSISDNDPNIDTVQSGTWTGIINGKSCTFKYGYRITYDRMVDLRVTCTFASAPTSLIFNIPQLPAGVAPVNYGVDWPRSMAASNGLSNSQTFSSTVAGTAWYVNGTATNPNGVTQFYATFLYSIAK